MECMKNMVKSVRDRCRRSHGDGSNGSYSILSKAGESFRKKKGSRWWKSSSSDEKQRQKKNRKRQVAPEGCLWVQVGAQRQRFVVKIELTNHPLFKVLLDDAEKEYGFRNDGPLWLPCDVDLFSEALAEMKISTCINADHIYLGFVGCTLSKGL